MKKYIYSLLAGTFVLNSTCAVRRFSSQKSGSNQDKLDVNNVSFMFPPPVFRQREIMELNGRVNAQKKFDALWNSDFWIPAFTQSGKTGLLSSVLLKELVEIGTGRHPTNKSKTGIDFNIVAGEHFQASAGTENEKEQKFDLSEAVRYRISSARFDPCPFEHRNPVKDKFSQSDFGRCTPEVRIVVQPFYGGTESTQNWTSYRSRFFGVSKTEILFGAEDEAPAPNTAGRTRDNLHKLFQAENPVGRNAGDFAAHFFFHLDHEEAKNSLQMLNQIKSEFESICPTSGVPLTIHPCLYQNWVPGGKANNFQQKLKQSLSSIIGSKKTKLDRIAFMGTNQGMDPWFFFMAKPTSPLSGDKLNSLPASSTNYLKMMPIVSIEKQEGVVKTEAAERDSTGKVTKRKPILDKNGNPVIQESAFTKGQVQMLEMVGFLTTFSSLATEHSNHVLPAAKDKNSAMNQEFRQSNPDHFEALRKSLVNLNPKLHDEYSLDCVSCHSSGRLQNVAIDQFGISTPREKKAAFKILTNGTNFIPEKGLTHHSLWAHSDVQGLGPRISLVNQFSFFHTEPVITQRIVNETLASVAFSNQLLFGSKQGSANYVCSEEQLNVCVDGARGGSGQAWRERLENQLSCFKTAEICSSPRKLTWPTFLENDDSY